MTATVGGPTDRTGPGFDAPPDDGPRIAAPVRPARRAGPRLRVHAGQIVVTQVAVAGSGVAAGRSALLVAGAAVTAAVLLVVTWAPVGGRWLYEWLGIWLRRAGRQRTLSPAASPAALLDLVAPGAVVAPAELAGEPAAVIGDGHGLTTLLELGDPAGIIGSGTLLPALPTLLPATDPGTPPVRLQLVLSGVPAPVPGVGGGPAGTSYRQLTGGRLLGQARAVLAVRVLRADGWSDAEQRRALSSAVRRVRRRLAPVGARPLGADAALRVLAELAHHDGGQPARETWPAVRLGGLMQASFRLRQARGDDALRRLAPHLLALPATATTVALGVGPWRAGGPALLPVELSVRIAAGGPAELALATRALRRLVTAEGGQLHRLDGEQLDGLAATLPLGTPGAPRPAPGATFDGLELPVDSAGLMLGTNRHGAPVTARLFRPEATRVVLVGGVRAAQLITLRAMALGARVVVRTSRPGAWEPFVRGVTVPGELIPLIPPGRPVGGPPGTPLRPLLVVCDVAPPVADARPAPGWQTTLVVRDELTAPDVELLARADLAVLQPLRPDEAGLAGTALGLGDSSAWLTRIRDDMAAVVNRQALRWVLLSPTPVEAQLIGTPVRERPYAVADSPGVPRPAGCSASGRGVTPSPPWVL
ncbi:type VII secretion protein EccE [Micromonospora sp. CPCC 206060]|uniref:type VII secretion protein EccE n=1 Tax=Micromonospora sp. CPCC 206060 TaxID=3122406 RepID=UPI002FF0AE04